MRPELVAWVLVHGLGVLINAYSILLACQLSEDSGRLKHHVLQGLMAVCALTIHLVSIVFGTYVVSDLSAGYVWGYAIFQGALFLTIGLSNMTLLRWEKKM